MAWEIIMAEKVEPAKGWSELEKCAWGKICAGQIVNFNAQDTPRPETSEGWDSQRQLSASFLRDILSQEPYRDAIAVEGVRIVGALFQGALDLSFSCLKSHLWLERCRFEKAVNLTGVQIDGWFFFEDSEIVEEDLAIVEQDKDTDSPSLDLRYAEIAGSVSMNRAFFKKNVDLTGATVTGHLSLTKATVEGRLNMIGLKAEKFISLDGATVEGKLNMSGLQVGQNLFMRAILKHDDRINRDDRLKRDPPFKRDAHVERNACFNGDVDLGSAKVTGHLDLFGATVKGQIILISAHIGSNLELSRANLGKLELSASRIDGELRLGSGEHRAPQWCDDAHLNLRNVQVGAVQDSRDRDPNAEGGWRDAWPRKKGGLELDGFTYKRLGGFTGESETASGPQNKDDIDCDMLARNIDWYIKWLERDNSYSPQPYEQLAAVFREAGEPVKADKILYASRERARKQIQGEPWPLISWVRRLGLNLLKLLKSTIGYGMGILLKPGLRLWVRRLGFTLLKSTIGYGIGIGYFRALWWVLGITLFGVAVLYVSGQPDKGLDEGFYGFFDRLSYSLDQLLPIVELNKKYDDDVKLNGVVKYYFYLHKLSGWALGSFLVAGLTGLTQKS
jgi:hypothetical protein